MYIKQELKRNSIFGLLICAFVVLASCNSEIDNSEEKVASKENGFAKIAFESTEHDFGKVRQGEKVGWYFSYKNEGTADLIILKAKASCGCTVPDYSSKPLHPGEKGQLKIVFDSSGRKGKEIKTVNIETNGKNPFVKLIMKVEVIETNN